MSKLPKLLSAAEVAEKLNLEKSQVYYVFHLEGFPVTQIGDRLYVAEDKLVDWLHQQTAAVM